MEYKSPIEITTKSYMTQVDDEILKAVHKVEIYVDKEELLRALRYDRDQFRCGFDEGYDTGYNQGHNDAIKEILKKIKYEYRDWFTNGIIGPLGEEYGVEVEG